jgi:hypothetical protein
VSRRCDLNGRERYSEQAAVAAGPGANLQGKQFNGAVALTVKPDPVDVEKANAGFGGVIGVDVELRDLRLAVVASQPEGTPNIGQSTVSRRLRDIEDRLGAVLFERTTGGTRPAIADLEFNLTAHRILEQVDTAFRRLKTRSRGEVGQLRIGVYGERPGMPNCPPMLEICRIRPPSCERKYDSAARTTWMDPTTSVFI